MGKSTLAVSALAPEQTGLFATREANRRAKQETNLYADINPSCREPSSMNLLLYSMLKIDN
jgi:hypothetical protein